MRFMILLKANEETEAGEMPSTELLAAMGKYNEELVKAGVMLAGEGLQPSSKGARVKFSANGDRTVTDGPFTEAKEMVAGFWIFQVKSKEEAVEWVKRCPSPLEGESEIEIRQVFEADDFGDALTPELREQEERLRAEVGLEPVAGARGPGGRTGSDDDLVAPRDGVLRDQSRHRRGLANRVGEADRRPGADRAGRGPG